MSKQPQATALQPDHKNRHKPEPAVPPGKASEFAGVTELRGGQIGPRRELQQMARPVNKKDLIMEEGGYVR